MKPSLFLHEMVGERDDNEMAENFPIPAASWGRPTL